MPRARKPIPGFNPSIIYRQINPFKNCCGVREVRLDVFFDPLSSTNLKNLTAKLLRVADVLVEDMQDKIEGNILVFTSSSGENDPHDIMLIRQLASVNVDLGENPISGYNLEMHIVYVNQLHDKIKQLKFI